MGLRGPKPTKNRNFTCCICGMEFIGTLWSKQGHATCSRECRGKAIARRKLTTNCKECGVELIDVQPTTKYCGPECRKAYNDKNQTSRPRVCEGCGVDYNATHAKQKYCTKQCTRLWARKKAMGEKPCKTCHKVFHPTPDTYMDYCCDECKSMAKRADWLKRNTARQSIVWSTPKKERVNVADIFARDNYTCQLCGIKTSRENGRYSANYPTIDHIIPLSKGGGHVASNLQCACRRCNMSKGNRVAV